jgi:hypothetical protein
MSIGIYPPPPTPSTDYFLEVAKGNVTGHTFMTAMGERESMGTTASGEDIWRGTATSIPTPADAGVQMDVVSTSAEDGAGGSTGVLTLSVHYLDAVGDEQEEIVTMNGTTPVPLNAANVRFVNDIHALTVGSNGVAVGVIDIYLQGSATTIYNMIDAGGNQSLVPHRMVPRAKTLYLQHWHATEAQNKRVALRIRSTDHNGVLIPGVFIFKDTTYIRLAATGPMPLHTVIPALSIVKVSGWAAVSGAESSCGWGGVLVDD